MNMFANGGADHPHHTSFILKVVFVIESEVVESKDKADECYYDGGSYTFVLFLVHCFF